MTGLATLLVEIKAFTQACAFPPPFLGINECNRDITTVMDGIGRQVPTCHRIVCHGGQSQDSCEMVGLGGFSACMVAFGPPSRLLDC